MDIQEKADQYAREIWGAYYDEIIPYGMDQTYGEIAKQDFIAGYNEAKRWIPVGESLPKQNELVLVKFELVKGCSDTIILELSDNNIWHYRGHDFRAPDKITHWREI